MLPKTNLKNDSAKNGSERIISIFSNIFHRLTPDSRVCTKFFLLLCAFWLTFTVPDGLRDDTTYAADPDEVRDDTTQQEKSPSKTKKVAQDEVSKDDEDVIDGTADQFERHEKQGIIILTGNAKINSPQGFLNADKVTLHEDPKTGDIIKAVAEGNIELRDKEALATSDRAVLHYINDTVDLRDNVVVIQNEDRLTSKHFISEQRTGKQIAAGNVKINRPNGFLNGDTVTIYKNVKTDELIRTIAEGNVELRDDEIFATCNHATLNHASGTVDLRENVVVIQDEDRLETVHFTYNQETGEQTGKGNVRFRVRVKRTKKQNTDTEQTEPPRVKTEK